MGFCSPFGTKYKQELPPLLWLDFKILTQNKWYLPYKWYHIFVVAILSCFFSINSSAVVILMYTLDTLRNMECNYNHFEICLIFGNNPISPESHGEDIRHSKLSWYVSCILHLKPFPPDLLYVCNEKYLFLSGSV